MSRAQLVNMVLCRRDVPLALAGLRSQVAASATPVRYRIIDDGSLRDEDGEALQGAAPCEILRDAQWTEWIAERLRAWPHTRTLRLAEPILRKLVDATLFAAEDSDGVCLIDPDILFFGRLESLFPPGSERLHLRETGDCILSTTRRELFWTKGLKYPAGFNTGFLRYTASDIDFDFIEWWVRKPELNVFPFLTEQTLHGVLFARSQHPAAVVGRPQFVCDPHFGGVTGRNTPPEIVAVHYLAGSKSRMVADTECAMQSQERCTVRRQWKLLPYVVETRWSVLRNKFGLHPG